MHLGYKPGRFIAQFEILFLTSCHDGFTSVMMRLREGRGERERKRVRGKKISSSYAWYYSPAGA
jgi:ribosomal protein S6E (S10)